MHCLRFTHNFPAGGCRALSKVIHQFFKSGGIGSGCSVASGGLFSTSRILRGCLSERVASDEAG